MGNAIRDHSCSLSVLHNEGGNKSAQAYVGAVDYGTYYLPLPHKLTEEEEAWRTTRPKRTQDGGEGGLFSKDLISVRNHLSHRPPREQITTLNYWRRYDSLPCILLWLVVWVGIPKRSGLVPAIITRASSPTLVTRCASLTMGINKYNRSKTPSA